MGGRRHSFQGDEKYTKTCKSGRFQRVRWDEGIYTCHRSQAPPLSSSLCFYKWWHPLCPFSCCLTSRPLLGAYTFEALQPDPCLWQYFSSQFLPSPLVVEPLDKNSELWRGTLLGQVTFLQLHLHFWLLKNRGGQYEVFPFLSDQIVNISKYVLYY